MNKAQLLLGPASKMSALKKILGEGGRQAEGMLSGIGSAGKSAAENMGHASRLNMGFGQKAKAFGDEVLGAGKKIGQHAKANPYGAAALGAGAVGAGGAGAYGIKELLEALEDDEDMPRHRR